MNNRISVTFTATATHHRLQFLAPSGGTTVGQVTYVDAILFHKGSTVGSPFDGDQPFCFWYGIPGASKSGQTISQTMQSDLTVVDCKPVRETQTDMPAGTRLVTGRAAAQLDLTLKGLVDATDRDEDDRVAARPLPVDVPAVPDICNRISGDRRCRGPHRRPDADDGAV